MIHGQSKHDQVVCPRCGIVYECKMGSINLCQCTAVQLTEEQRYYVGSRFGDCLCVNCLAALQTEHNQIVQQNQFDRGD